MCIFEILTQTYKKQPLTSVTYVINSLSFSSLEIVERFRYEVGRFDQPYVAIVKKNTNNIIGLSIKMYRNFSLIPQYI